MGLQCAFALTVVLVLFLSSTEAVETSIIGQEKEFVTFESEKMRLRTKTSSIINVPINCPSDRVRIGNRCRAIF
ncbi:uncharacterized protein LOC143221795 [Lasioglossum baleicum]|uniref:uncharacterized protein LOC143221795 n=1 Tax=Lasioglossum baleicum TaxID=434251 RepID=UPI003FCDC032